MSHKAFNPNKLTDEVECCLDEVEVDLLEVHHGEGPRREVASKVVPHLDLRGVELLVPFRVLWRPATHRLGLALDLVVVYPRVPGILRGEKRVKG